MNAVIAHGGGPTAVINASLAGLIEGCRDSGRFHALWGARAGVAGLLEEQFVELLGQDHSLINAIADTPGSALGSSRRKLAPEDLDRIVHLFRKRDVRCFFYTGGNGSMGTALAVEQAAHAQAYDLQVLGIPKTIDNDLAQTDHTPGYPSTAHFFACAARDIGEDNRSLPSPICILETLGRNVGWIVAATAFARKEPDDAPHLIYFPERPVSLERICSDTERVYRRLGRVAIAVCEGQMDDRGQPFGASVDSPDSPVHRLASNLGHTLASRLTECLGIRARAEKPGLLGRSTGTFTTALDRQEARACGQAAAQAAAEGRSGEMVAIRRAEAGPYATATTLVPLGEVASVERKLPNGWIAPEGNDVAPAFLDYARPLVPAIQAYPRFAALSRRSV